MANILVVDDDRTLVQALCTHLQRVGHRCVSETNGARGFKLLNDISPDLILLDVMIPGMSGFEFCRKVRTHKFFYATPIIFMSSMCSDEEIAHALAQGADDFLRKPLQMEVVQRRIGGFLDPQNIEDLRDASTGLPGKKQVRLDLQRILNAKIPFAIMYLEIVNIVPFGRTVGEPVRQKAIRHFSRALKKCGTESGAKLFRAGHMGGGHFVVVMDSPVAKDFCDHLRQAWAQHIPVLYAEVGLEKALAVSAKAAPNQAAVPVLDLLICHTEHDPAILKTPAEVLETLSNIRQRAASGQKSGIFFDRRSELSSAKDIALSMDD